MASFVEYIRVSTAKQGESGLGMEAQAAAIRQLLKPGDRIIATFAEIETGKSNARPELARALAHCRQSGASLIIGKLDRLSRSVAFISGLMESGVTFIAADMPHAKDFELHIRAALAQEERRLISERTRQALARARQRGTVLGGYRGRALTNEERQRGATASARARSLKAAQRAAQVGVIIRELREQGITTLNALARALGARGIATPRGGNLWRPAQVSRVLAAVERA